MFWAALAVMSGLAALIALWPLAFRGRRADGPSSEADFYRAQLQEIERDVERGALPADEAASARTETARRLIAAAEPSESDSPAKGELGRRRIAAVAILVLVPVVALGVYLKLGHPDSADQPLKSRHSNVVFNTEAGLEAAIAKIEARLATHPDDARGWRVLAPIYMRLGRYEDAVASYKQLLRLAGDLPEPRAGFGEALVAANGGEVTAEAREAFQRALEMQPGMPMARFYLALADEQDGNPLKALEVYSELAPQATGDEPWMLGLQNRLVALQPGAATPKFSESADQKAMIEKMVAGLAERLHKGGGSAEEWEKLIRAYVVMQQPDQAKDALADARKAFAADKDALAHLDALASTLGL